MAVYQEATLVNELYANDQETQETEKLYEPDSSVLE